MRNPPPCLLLFPPVGEGDAEDAWLQRSENVNTDHRAVHGRPSAGAVETAGHHHDRQVQTALGWTRWEEKQTTHTQSHTHACWLFHRHTRTHLFPSMYLARWLIKPKHWHKGTFACFFYSCAFTCPLLSKTAHTHTQTHTLTTDSPVSSAHCECKFGSSARVPLWIRSHLMQHTVPHPNSKYYDLRNVFKHATLYI